MKTNNLILLFVFTGFVALLVWMFQFLYLDKPQAKEGVSVEMEVEIASPKVDGPEPASTLQEEASSSSPEDPLLTLYKQCVKNLSDEELYKEDGVDKCKCQVYGTHCSPQAPKLKKNKKIANEVPVKKKVVRRSHFRIPSPFNKWHWKFYLQNECLDPKDCCNTLKQDPGGRTCYGVAEKSNPQIFKNKGCEKESFKNISGVSKEYLMNACYGFRAKKLIMSDYWDKPKISLLHPNWRQPVFDFGVHSGQRRAVKYLQRVLGLKDDGFIGKHTIGTSYAKHSEDLVNKYLQAREHFLRNLKIYQSYPKGMENRIKKNRRQTFQSIKNYK